MATTATVTPINTFERVESRVRSYSRSFPKVFDRAIGSTIYDTNGKAYTDFLAGCSTLNYGHNDPDLKSALIEYISNDGIAHGLDMFTDAKEHFLSTFERLVLRPRGMTHQLQFTGPTGANAVEAAMKLARKVTGRTNIISFTNGFHGVTMGALAATGNGKHRGGAAMPLSGVARAAYDGYHGPDINTADLLERQLSDPSSGIDAPAAIIVETVQGEGGLNAASPEWLRQIQAIARKHGALFIIDDIQAGCGRTGGFFSFDGMGLSPDIITMAKSLSGMGLPLAMTLIKPEHDIWKPAEHNGTFRGNNHAFVTAAAALEKFWSDDRFISDVNEKARYLGERLAAIADEHGLTTKGRGMMVGVDAGSGENAAAICKACFAKGLIIETSGSFDEVVKVLCPLTISLDQLTAGIDIMETAFDAVLGSRRAAAE
ncbi:diaminobutyrate-2-oxoglutarate transaminase [Devosia subaequoris]|uniref:Diaminobutyrate--2-oxoglutarate transaminase n=1 Tax=Devosia subaequoris TaxID=395930 RepID=A0A7W6IJN0_9HYPH|nr:diaminobutyrate--2-oxoglutarate transaminase [Devosia subaequoris]MBB4050852.1 diaminobutyrate-2-oxoglutarate transaminase [Devosia subaequoris]MCP1208471.1 diaminobutyrate--2-oxoglutarate transaminase [Devosia subaequoris]